MRKQRKMTKMTVLDSKLSLTNAFGYFFQTGTVNGKEIRAASIKGSSVRGEFGMRMDATKDNPWSTDISLYGYGGKHRGFGGNVSVAYTF